MSSQNGQLCVSLLDAIPPSSEAIFHLQTTPQERRGQELMDRLRPLVHRGDTYEQWAMGLVVDAPACCGRAANGGRLSFLSAALIDRLVDDRTLPQRMERARVRRDMI